MNSLMGEICTKSFKGKVHPEMKSSSSWCSGSNTVRCYFSVEQTRTHFRIFFFTRITLEDMKYSGQDMALECGSCGPYELYI